MNKLEELINDELIVFNLMATNKDNSISYYEFESTQNRPELVGPIYELFEKSCSCMHDCCGHWFTSSILLLSMYKDQWVIRIVYAQNY